MSFEVWVKCIIKFVDLSNYRDTAGHKHMLVFFRSADILARYTTRDCRDKYVMIFWILRSRNRNLTNDPVNFWCWQNTVSYLCPSGSVLGQHQTSNGPVLCLNRTQELEMSVFIPHVNHTSVGWNVDCIGNFQPLQFIAQMTPTFFLTRKMRALILIVAERAVRGGWVWFILYHSRVNVLASITRSQPIPLLAIHLIHNLGHADKN